MGRVDGPMAEPLNPSVPNANPDWQIALLIDADNVSHTRIAALLGELAKYGTANVRRAYGDWTMSTLKGWKEKLHEFAIRPVQQFSYTSGKNASDMALVIDAMELLYTKRPAAFSIASSDADFTPLVMHLRDAGCAVFGFGDRKTPSPFVNACTTFLYLDSLGEPGAPASTAEPEVAPVGNGKPAADKANKPGKRLAQDAKLVEILRNAVEASMRDDGWRCFPPPAAAPSASPRSTRAITARRISRPCSRRPACSTSSAPKAVRHSSPTRPTLTGPRRPSPDPQSKLGRSQRSATASSTPRRAA